VVICLFDKNSTHLLKGLLVFLLPLKGKKDGKNIQGDNWTLIRTCTFHIKLVNLDEVIDVGGQCDEGY
jgi:hypothetical protein